MVWEIRMTCMSVHNLGLVSQPNGGITLVNILMGTTAFQMLVRVTMPMKTIIFRNLFHCAAF